MNLTKFSNKVYFKRIVLGHPYRKRLKFFEKVLSVFVASVAPLSITRLVPIFSGASFSPSLYPTAHSGFSPVQNGAIGFRWPGNPPAWFIKTSLGRFDKFKICQIFNIQTTKTAANEPPLLPNRC